MKKRWLIALGLIVANSACGPEPTEQSPADTVVPASALQLSPLWPQIAPSLVSPAISAKDFNQSVTTFLSIPTETNLKVAQQHWQKLAVSVQHLRFIHAITTADPVLFNRVGRTLNRIMAKPITPGYLDTFGPYSFSGIVNDISLPITRETLLEQHGATADSDILLGLYSIEYLLFGENQSRQVSDFVARDALTAEERDMGYKSPAEISENRRRKLLALQSAQLVEDIEALPVLWGNNSDTQANWEQLNDRAKIETITRAFTKSTTELMIELAEFNHEQLDDYEGITSPAERRLSSIEKAHWIQIAAEALFPAATFMEDSKKQFAETTLREIIELAKQGDDSISPESLKTIWEKIYALSKSLIQPINTGGRQSDTNTTTPQTDGLPHT